TRGPPDDTQAPTHSDATRTALRSSPTPRPPAPIRKGYGHPAEPRPPLRRLTRQNLIPHRVPGTRRLEEAGVERLVHHAAITAVRSEEHTSELQSRENLVCRLLLEKKKNRRWHAV